MSRRRFFIDPAAIVDGLARLVDDEARHLARVLRLGPGAEVELLDGAGGRYLARVESLSSREVWLAVVEPLPAAGGGEGELVLAQALLKGKKMELLLQKASELGVDEFVPVLTSHCERRVVAQGVEQRWQRILREACKQCGRALPMRLAPVTRLDDLLMRDFASRVMLYEREYGSHGGERLAGCAGGICLLIGPEGGFEADEVRAAKEAGFVTVHLGERVLRAETAALSAVAVSQFLRGRLGAAALGRE